MKKITILSLPFLIILLFLLLSGTHTKAQNADQVKATITELNTQIGKWFNAGQIDSIGLLYQKDACMIPSGQHEIKGREHYYKSLYASGFRFMANKSEPQLNSGSETFVISDSIAVLKASWAAMIGPPNENVKIKGYYLTQ